MKFTITILLLAALSSCVGGPGLIAKRRIGVYSVDFNEPLEDAMNILNKAVGCDWLVHGHDVKISNDASGPCGDTWNDDLRPGHSAGAWDCRDGTYEIAIVSPGDIHTQLCVIMHELGHVGGLSDSTVGRIMNQAWCPDDFVWPLAAESTALRRDFCQRAP